MIYSPCISRKKIRVLPSCRGPPEELIPSEVRSKVLGLAGKGSALIIEMLWSSSAYLPAHKGGLKYKEPLGLIFGDWGSPKLPVWDDWLWHVMAQTWGK